MPSRVPFAPSSPFAQALQQEQQVQAINEQAAFEQDFIAQQQREQKAALKAQEDAAAAAAKQQRETIARAKKAGVKVQPDATGIEQIATHPDGAPVYEAGFVGAPQVTEKGGAAKYRDARGQSYDVPFDAIREEKDPAGETFYSFDVSGPDGSKQTMRQPAGTKPLFRTDPTTGNRLADMTDPATGSVKTQVVGLDPVTASTAAIAKRRDALQLRQNEISGEADQLRLEQNAAETKFRPVAEKFSAAEKAYKDIKKATTRFEERSDGIHQVTVTRDGKEFSSPINTNDPATVAKAKAWVETAKRTAAEFEAAKVEHDPAKAALQAMQEKRDALALQHLAEKRRAEAEIRKMEDAAKAGQPVYLPEWQKRAFALVQDRRVQDLEAVADLEAAGDPLAEDVKRVSLTETNKALNQVWGKAFGASDIGEGVLRPGAPTSKETRQGITQAENRVRLVDGLAAALTTGKTATATDSKTARELAAKSLGMNPDGVEVSEQRPEGHYELSRNGELFASLDPRNNRLTLLDTQAGLGDKGAEIIANASPDGVPVYMVSSEQPYKPAEVRDLIRDGVNAASSAKTNEEAAAALAAVGLDSAGIRQKVMAGKLSVQDGKMLNEKLNNVKQVNTTAPAVKAEFGKWLAETPIMAAKFSQGTREDKAAVVNQFMDTFAAKASAGVVLDRSILAERRNELLSSTDDRGSIAKGAAYTGGAMKNGIASLAGIGYWLLRAPDRAIRLVGGTDDEGTNLVWNQSRDLVQRLAGENAPWNRDSSPMATTFGELQVWADRADSVDDLPDELAERMAEEAFTNYHGFSDASAADVETSRDTFNVKRNPALRGMLERYLKTGNAADFNGLFGMLKSNAKERETGIAVQQYIERPRAATPAEVAGRARLLGVNLDANKAAAVLQLSKQIEDAKDEKQYAALLKQVAGVIGIEKPEHAALALAEIARLETTDPESWTGMFRGASVAGVEEMATEVVSDVALAALSATLVGAPEAVALKGAQVAAKQGIRGAFKRLVTHNLDNLTARSATFAKVRNTIGTARKAFGAEVTQLGDEFASLGMQKPTFGQPLTRGQKLANLAVGTVKATLAGAPIEALEEGLTAVLSNDPSLENIEESMLQGALGVGGITPAFAGVQAVRNAFAAKRQMKEWSKVKSDYIANLNAAMAKVPGFKPMTVEDFDAWQGLQNNPAHQQARQVYSDALAVFQQELSLHEEAAAGNATLPVTPELLAAQAQLKNASKALELTSSEAFMAMDEIRALPEGERPLYTAAAKAAAGVTDFTEAEAKALMQQSGANAVAFQQAQVLPADVAGPPAQRGIDAPEVTAAAPGVYRIPEGVKITLPPALLTMLEAKAPSTVALMGRGATAATTPATGKPGAQGNTTPKTKRNEKVQTQGQGKQGQAQVLTPADQQAAGGQVSPAVTQSGELNREELDSLIAQGQEIDKNAETVVSVPVNKGNVIPLVELEVSNTNGNWYSRYHLNIAKEGIGMPWDARMPFNSREEAIAAAKQQMFEWVQRIEKRSDLSGKDANDLKRIRAILGEQVQTPVARPKTATQAPAQTNTGKPLPAKAIEKVTREAIGRVAAKSPRIKALLKESKKAHRYPTGGMWLDDNGKVVFHVPTIIQQLESIGVTDNATAGKRVEALIDEEIRHSANMEAARRLFATEQGAGRVLRGMSFETWRDAWYGDIWNSHFTDAMRQAVQEAYGDTLPEADWMRAMEGLRMLDQLRATGSITEAVLLALDAILESLREFLDLVTAGGKKVVEAEIQAIREVLAEYGYEGGTVKPDAKKKPAKPKAKQELTAPVVPTSIADSPSPNVPPRATENVQPRPPRNGRDTSVRDAWDEQYGDMRKDGRTHNDDGTPYQPTVFDEVMQNILAAKSQMTDDQANERIGEWSEARIATSVKTLLNAGWTWDAENQRWQQPEDNPIPNERPLDAILRLQGKTPKVAPSTAPAVTPAAPKRSAAEKALGLPAGALAGQSVVQNSQAIPPATTQTTNEKEQTQAQGQRQEVLNPVPETAPRESELSNPDMGSAGAVVRESLGHESNRKLWDSYLENVKRWAKLNPDKAKIILEDGQNIRVAVVGGTTDPARNTTARGDIDLVFDDNIQDPDLREAVSDLQTGTVTPVHQPMMSPLDHNGAAGRSDSSNTRVEASRAILDALTEAINESSVSASPVTPPRPAANADAAPEMSTSVTNAPKQASLPAPEIATLRNALRQLRRWKQNEGFGSGYQQTIDNYERGTWTLQDTPPPAETLATLEAAVTSARQFWIAQNTQYIEAQNTEVARALAANSKVADVMRNPRNDAQNLRIYLADQIKKALATDLRAKLDSDPRFGLFYDFTQGRIADDAWLDLMANRVKGQLGAVLPSDGGVTEATEPSREELQKTYAKFKRALSKAVKAKDYAEIIRQADAFQKHYETDGNGPFPDSWSDWERHKADAEMQLARQGKNPNPLVVPILKPVTPPRPAANADADYLKAQEDTRAALGGLFSAPVRRSIPQLEVPEERFDAVRTAAKSIIAAKIRTPEAFAKFLDDTFPGGKARPYSEAIWDVMGVWDKSLRGTHDWSRIYGDIDQPLPDVQEPENIADQEPPAETPPANFGAILRRLQEVQDFVATLQTSNLASDPKRQSKLTAEVSLDGALLSIATNSFPQARAELQRASDALFSQWPNASALIDSVADMLPEPAIDEGQSNQLEKPTDLDKALVDSIIARERSLYSRLPDNFWSLYERLIYENLIPTLSPEQKNLLTRINNENDSFALSIDTAETLAISDIAAVYNYLIRSFDADSGKFQYMRGETDDFVVSDDLDGNAVIALLKPDVFDGIDFGDSWSSNDGPFIRVSPQDLQSDNTLAYIYSQFRRIHEAKVARENDNTNKLDAPALDPVRELILSPDNRAKKAQAMKKLAEKRGETLKQTQEFVESRLVQIADEVAREDWRTPQDRFEELVGIYDKQPLFSARTSTSMENQAYSTPAPMAFALRHMTGVTPQTSVYDATAGNGMLAIGSDLKNSVANEIDETRLEGLRRLGIGTITTKDATDPTGAFQNRPKAQTVHLNPPFGGIPNVNFDGYGIRKLEHIISLQALKEGMADNGTAAIILGATMNNQEQVKGAQWVFENYLYAHYNVVDNFEVSGELYGNQGAKWPVRILVIAGKKAVPTRNQDLAPKTVDRLDTWSDVWARAERTRYEVERQRQTLGTDGQAPAPSGNPAGNTGTADSRPIPDSQRTAASTSSGSGVRGGNAGGQSRPGATGAGSSGLAAPGVTEQPADAGTSVQPATGGRKPAASVGGRGGRRPASATNAPSGSSQTGGATDASGQNPANAGSVTPRPERRKAAATATQVPYDPASNGSPFETLVPRGIGESLQTALAEIIANRGPIDQYVADRLDMSVADLHKAMAAEQIDGVAMAIYQMETGGALIIGDETGIGKGRQAASLIRYAILQGKIPVFFTKDPKLFSDMWGDLKDIGTTVSGPNVSASDMSVRPLILGDSEKAQIKTPDNVVVLKPASNARQSTVFAAARQNGFASTGHNAIFSTYSQIRDPNARQEFLEWLAANDDVIVVLDEAHESAGDGETSMQAAFMMGGTVKRGKGSSKTEITKSGLLNRPGTMHPRGGVLYLSATFAKRPDNMPVYFRTDLRKGADKFSQVVEAMDKGGVALQQAITEALAEAGQYTRRERDFTGVSYAMKQVTVRDEAELVRQVDAVTGVLSAIANFSKLIRAAVKDSTARTDSQSSMTDFASIVHNQVSQLLLAAKADAVVDEVVEAHKRGEKPIVALMNTMESFLSQYVDDMNIKPGQPMKLNWAALLEYALSRTLRASEKLPNGDTVIYTVDPAEHGLGMAYQRVLSAARAVNVAFPVSPIDYIIQKARAGGVEVGELTGRESGIDYTNFQTGEGTYRKFKRADKNTLVNTFNNGSLAGMLLNASGSTGLSIHAASKFKDQKPRHMIIAQPALDINVFIQTLGRIKRTGIVLLGRYPDGSAYGARYSHLTLPLNSELRPAIMAARKMKSLNANTTGESDSAVKIEAEDLMNRFGNQVVAEYLSRNPELQDALNIEVEEREDGTVVAPKDIARKFTGRMALQPNKVQGEAYAEIISDYRRAIEQAKVTGDYDLEIIVHEDWDATRSASEQIVAGTDESSIFTSSVNVELWDMTDNRPTPSGADMLAEFTKENGSQQQLDARWQEFSKQVDERLDSLEQRLRQRLAEASGQLAGMSPDDPAFKGLEREVASLERNLSNVAVKKARWRDTQRRLDDIIDEAGRPVMLENAETQEMDHGMLTQIRFPDITGQLRIAPSAFKMTYLLNRPGGRIYPTLAQFKPDGYTQARSQYSLDDMTGDRGGRRERRTLLVGSPIRAYGATGGKGKVVRFKARDGSLVTGILMPRSWNISNLAEDPRKELADAGAVEKYMRDLGWTSGFVESGDSVRIHAANGGFRISAPSARRTGGEIFLDAQLREIVGDFIRNGQRMTARIDSISDVPRVAARVMQLTGKRFKGQDVARVRKANGVDENADMDSPARTAKPKSAVKAAATEAWNRYLEQGGSSAPVNQISRDQWLNRIDQEEGRSLSSAPARRLGRGLADMMPQLQPQTSATAFEADPALPPVLRTGWESLTMENASPFDLFPMAADAYRQQIRREPKKDVQTRILNAYLATMRGYGAVVNDTPTESDWNYLWEDEGALMQSITPTGRPTEATGAMMPTKAAAPSPLGERWWAATTREEARTVLEPSSLEELKAIATRMDVNPNQSKSKIIDRLVQLTGVYADSVSIRGINTPRGPMPDYTGRSQADKQRMQEQQAKRERQRALEPKERLPAKAKPRTPEEFARDMAAIMTTPDRQRVGTVGIPMMPRIAQAYRAVASGSSSQFVPIRTVFQRIKAAHPETTPEDFMAEITAADERGDIMVEAPERPETVQAAGPFVVRNAVGVPSTNMMVVDDGGNTLASAPVRTSNVTPAQDAEYLAAVEAGDMEKAQRMVDAALNKVIESLPVSDNENDIPNTRSISSSLSDWEERGVREVPVEYLVNRTGEKFPSYMAGGFDRTRELADRIENEGITSPMILVWENEKYPYVLEGNTRYDALRILASTGRQLPDSVPALIVVDKSADPVTYDDRGNVIPLSQRFNPESDSILYSAPARTLGNNADFAVPPSDEDAIEALSSDKKNKFGLARSLPPGQSVGLRIDIPAFNRTGKYVVSVHEKAAGSSVGRIIGYDTIVRVNSPTFFVNESGSAKIRDGNAKFPIATVEGLFNPSRDIPFDINEWTPAGFDPKEHSYFYDKRTDQRIIGGDEAISVGNSVFVKNPKFGDVAESLYSAPVRTLPESPFYSKLARVVSDKMPNRADVSTIKGIVTNTQTGIKAEELKWSGILPWLESQSGPVSKQAVLDYLASDGAVKLEEVRASKEASYADWLSKRGVQDPESSPEYDDDELHAQFLKETGAVKFESYQLPGGENYREVVLAMPEDRLNVSGIKSLRESYQAKYGSDWYDLINPDEKRVFHDAVDKAAQQQLRPSYTSSHFPDVRNYVAHMRLNDRTDAEGQPGTFIEEIQSDRHQAGREKGYKPTQEEIEAQMRVMNQKRDAFLAAEKAFNDAREASRRAEYAIESWESPDGNRRAKAPQNLLDAADYYTRRRADAERTLNQAREAYAATPAVPDGTIPDAPFRTTWPLQMFKRALAEAVAQGKQWIGWTTGDTQAERYDLSKQVDKIEVYPLEKSPGMVAITAYKDGRQAIRQDVARGGMADLIGKEAAQKAEQQLQQNNFATLEGDGLKVGGEGMKGFYDTILPKEIGKYVKQWGAGVVKDSILTQNSIEKKAFPNRKYEPDTPIWRVDITPPMKAGVESGQALFSAPIRKAKPATTPNRATQAMRDIIEGLPEPHRKVLRDLLVNNVSIADAATKHDLSETAVGNILRRGEAHLRVMMAANATKPTVQVQDGVVKAVGGRPDLALSGNAAVAGVDQRRMTPEEVTHAEMNEMASRLFSVDSDAAERLVVRWMDSGTTVLSTDGFPDGIKAIVADAQARSAAEMLMTAAAKLLVTQKAMAGGNTTQIARLIYLYRNTGTEQARALGMRQDPFDTPAERAAMYLQETLLTPPESMRNELRRNPANRERILAAWAARADKLKAELLAEGIDLDATFREFAKEQELAEATIPEPVKPVLARAPKRTRQLVKALLQGLKPSEAIEAAGMTAKAAYAAYKAFRESINQAGTEAAKAMQDQLLRSAPAGDFAANLGLPDLTEAQWLDAVAKGKPLVTTEATEALKQQRERKKAGGELDLKNPLSVNKARRAIEERKSNLFDKMSEFWRASILSGPQTHVVNVVSGLTFGTYEATFKKLAIGAQADIARMFGLKPDAASLSDIPAMIAATLPAIRSAFLDSIKAWKSETRIFDAYALQLTDADGALFKESFSPALKGTFGKVMRGISFRLMGAADEFVKSFFTRIEVAAQARQIARNEGKTGLELANAIAELMEPGSLAWERALGQAKKITFQTEIGSESGTIDNAVDGFAKLITRTKKGDFGKVLRGLSHFTFPFVDTPTNIFKQGVTMSPVGGLLAIVDATRALIRHKQGNTEEAQRIYNAARALDDLTNQIVAWGFIIGLSELVKPGDDDEELPYITGTIPWRSTSPGEREIAYRTAPPQSIRIGGQWYSYKRLDPFASALAFTVDAIKEMQSGKPLEEAWGKIGLGMLRNMQDKTFLQGISDVVNAVQDPERFGTKWATNIAIGFVPNLIRQPIRTGDDVFRENDLPNDMGFWEALGRRVGFGVYPKGWQGGALPNNPIAPMPAFDVWGREAAKNTGTGQPTTDWLLRLLSPVDTLDADNVDPLDRALLRYNMTHPDDAFGVAAPSREIRRTIGGKVVNVSLNDDEYTEFVRSAGQAARAMLGDTFTGRDLTEQDVKNIKSIISDVHDNYRNDAFGKAVQARGGISTLANTTE